MSSGFWRAACGRGAVLAAALWLGAAAALAQTAPPEPPVIYQIQPGQSLVDGSHLWLLPPANTGGAPITKIHTFFTNPEDGVGYSASGDVPSPPYPIFPININGWFVDYATQAVFSVWAENSVGFSPTLVVSISTGLRAPTAPRNLRAETLDGEISLFWNIPLNSGGPPNTYYTSQYRIFYGGSTTLTISAGEYIQPGLQYNIGKFAEQTVISVDTSAARGISIWARNAVGWGPVAVATAAAYSPPAAATTAPGAPVSLTVYFNAFDAYAMPQTPGQVRFFPPTVRANLATGFYILYNGQSVDISHTAGQTGQKTRNITGLTRGNTVVFSVVAKGASGNGPAAVYSVRIPATGPAKVSNLRVIQSNAQQAVFTFDAPTFWGGWGPFSSPYSYQMYRVNTNNNSNFPGSGLGNGGLNVNTTGNVTVTITRGNSPGNGHEYAGGRRYSFRIVSRSNADVAIQNRLGDLIYFTVPGNPSPPQNVTGQPRNGQVILSWGAPASWGEGGGGATDNARIVYGVATGTVSYTLWHSYSNPADQRPEVTVNPITINKLWVANNVGENLINGVAYKFEVAVLNAQGNVGTLSAPITVTPAVPSPPSAVQNLAVTAGDRQFVVTWDSPTTWGSSPQMDYIVTMQRLGVSDVYTVTNVAITLTSHSSHSVGAIGVLNPADTYRIQVVPRSQAGLTGPLSQLVRAPGSSPEAPNVTAVTLTSGVGISVSWAAANNNAWNTSATAYALRLGSVAATLGSATTATVFSGLLGGAAYTLSVWGISPLGAGAARVLTVTTASEFSTPSAVQSLTAAVRALSFVASWESPTTWGGSQLSVYRVFLLDPFTNLPGTFYETTDTRFTLTAHTGSAPLVEGAEYFIGVQSHSQATIDSTQVARFPPHPGRLTVVGITAPNAPVVVASPTPVGLRPGQVTLSWSVPYNGGSPITAYIFQSGTVSANLPTSQTMSVVDIAFGVGYAFTLQAANNIGASPAAVVSASIAASSSPGNFHSEPCGRGCLILEWHRPTDDSQLVEYNMSGIDGGGRAVLNQYIPASGTGPVSDGKVGNLIYTALPAIAPVVRLTVRGLGGGVVSYNLWPVRSGRINYSPAPGFNAAPTPQADTPTLRAVVSDASSSVYVSGATLFWSHPNDNGNAIQAYYLSYNDNVVSLASTATAYTPAGLVDGTQYAFTLQATNAIWMSEPGVLSVLPYSRPGDVSNIQYADIGNGRVSLSWNPPANTGGLSLLYFIEDTYATATHTANANSYTLGVAGEGTVTLTVNIAAAGNPSVSVFAKGGSVAAVVAVSAAPPLSAPRNFRVVSRDARYGFIVEWDEPASWGGSTLSLYRVGMHVGFQGESFYETADTRLTISSLQGSSLINWVGGGFPYYRIRARSQAGENSPWSATFIDNTNVSQSPDAPNVAATALAGGTQISVSWSKANNQSHNNAATAYAVNFGGVNSTLASSITSTVFGGLQGNTAYTLSVRGIAPIGAGAIRVVTATTDFANPGVPRNLVATPGDGFLIFTWDEPADWGGSTLSVYRAFFGQVGGPLTSLGDYAVASVSVSGTNGTQYRFRVRARSQAGKNGPYTPFVIATPAALPSRPVVTAGINANGEEMTLSWSANAGGSPINAFLYSFNGGALVTLTSGTITSTVEAGLAKNSPHTLSLAAANANGTSAFTVAVFNTPATNPTPPRNVRTVEVGDGYVVFTWDEPADWGGSSLSVYQYAYRQVGGTHAPFNQTNNTATVSGLTNGEMYEFFAYAQSQANLWSDSSPTLTATPFAEPAAPSIVATANANGTEISLSWSANNNGSPITAYALRLGGVNATLGGGITSTIVGNLQKYTGYTLSLWAINSAGAGAVRALTLTTAATAPDAPPAPQVVRAGATAAISWSAPADNGGYSIVGYRLVAAAAGGFSVSISVTMPTANITGLPNGFATAMLYAVSQDGEGANLVSEARTFVIPPGGTPTEPTNLSAVAVTTGAGVGTQINLSWGAPTSTVSVTAYIAHYEGYAQTLDANETSALITALTQGDTYAFTVRAVNSKGEGPAAVAMATTPDVPGAPAALAAVAGNTRAVLTWTPPAGGLLALTGYQVVYGTTTISIANGRATGYTVTGLTNGTSYSFALRAFNALGGGASLVASATPAAVAPDAPMITAAYAGDEGEAVIAWDMPQEDGGGQILHYVIYRNNTSVTMAAAEARTATLANLSFVAHTLAVAARNNIGEGAQAAAVVTVQGKPGAPANFSAADGFMQAVLTWQPPTLTNNAAITGYVITYNGETIPLPAAARGHTVTGLTNGAAYSFTLQAANRLGAGAVTAASAMPQNVEPDAPQNLQASAGDGFVVLQWSAPANNGGAAIIQYVVSYNGESATTTATAITLTMLTDGTEYTFGVAAVNSIGTGQMAQISQRAYSAPAAPTEVSFSQSGDELLVSWTAPASDGGDAINGYEIFVSQSTNGGSPRVIATAGGNAASATGGVNNLMATTYYAFVRARNAAGFGAAGRSSGVSLSLASVLTPEKQKEIDKTILPAVAGVLSQQLANIVGDRIAAPALDVNVGGNLNLLGAKLGAGNAKRGIAQMLKQHGGALANGGEVSESALRNGSFALPLAAAGDSAAGVKMGVWGGAAYGNMENEKSAIQYDGKNAAYYTGMDATFGDEESKTKVGAMFVHSRADANYTDSATGGAGEYNMHANSGKGYLGWSGKNYSAHGSFGFGKGEVKIQAAGGDSETRKVNLYSASAGGRAALLRGENGALWGEADWSIADIRFASGGGEGSRAQNLRAALEASQQIRFVSGGGVEPFMRAGYLRRFGETSANGWETGAGLRWSAAARWRGEFRARYAQYNSGDKQLGVAAVVRAEAANNRGLALSLTPQYNESAATMGAELTYGIATSAALWRPRLAAKIGEATEYQAGAQWQSLLQNRVALRAALTATRKQQTTALNLTFGARY